MRNPVAGFGPPLRPEGGRLWIPTPLTASDGAPNDRFGTSVSVDGDAVLVGARKHGPDSTGAAYVFRLDPPGSINAYGFGFGDGSWGACPCGNTSEVGAGEGSRNSTGSMQRMPLLQATGTGSVTWPDLHAAGAWDAGDTRYFQAFYRDTFGSPCGSGFNTTNGVQIVFEL
ncbi:MAG: hypothetical protein GY711_28710 [bacterium]|nr:hypothetical protein [bacterium]